jgi:hypothetical protein
MDNKYLKIITGTVAVVVPTAYLLHKLYNLSKEEDNCRSDVSEEIIYSESEETEESVDGRIDPEIEMRK